MIGKKTKTIIGATMFFLMTVGIMAIAVTSNDSGGFSPTLANLTIVSDSALQCYSCNVSLE